MLQRFCSLPFFLTASLFWLNHRQAFSYSIFPSLYTFSDFLFLSLYSHLFYHSHSLSHISFSRFHSLVLSMALLTLLLIVIALVSYFFIPPLHFFSRPFFRYFLSSFLLPLSLRGSFNNPGLSLPSLSHSSATIGRVYASPTRYLLLYHTIPRHSSTTQRL